MLRTLVLNFSRVVFSGVGAQPEPGPYCRQAGYDHRLDIEQDMCVTFTTSDGGMTPPLQIKTILLCRLDDAQSKGDESC